MKKLINEAPLPKGFGKFGGGGGLPKGFGKFGGGQGNVDYKTPKVTHCKTLMSKNKQGVEREIMHAFIIGLKKGDEQLLCDEINKTIPNMVMIATPGTDEGSVILQMNMKMLPDIMAKWGSYVDAAVQTLFSNNPDYKLKGSLDTQLSNQISSCPTQADIKAMKVNIGSNYKELFQNFQDLKTQNKFLAMQAQNLWVKEYGTLYAFSMALAVYAQKPDAVFVTTKAGWSFYNRTIKPNAKKIILDMPDQKDPPLDKKHAAAKKYHYKDWWDVLKNCKSSQIMHAIVVLAQKMMGRATTHWQAVYDVSDTIPPTDPKDDKWTLESGLSDNLTGALNDVAQKEHDLKDPASAIKRKEEEEKKKKLQQAQGTIDPEAKKKVDRRTFWALIKRMQEYAIPLPNLRSKDNKNATPDDIEADILNMAYTYAINRMPDENIYEPELQKKISGLVCLAIAVRGGYGFQAHSLARFCPREVTEQEAYTAFAIISQIIPIIHRENKMSRRPMLEDFEIEDNSKTMTIDEFLNKVKEMFGEPDVSIQEKRKFKNEFNNIFKRING